MYIYTCSCLFSLRIGKEKHRSNEGGLRRYRRAKVDMLQMFLTEIWRNINAVDHHHHHHLIMSFSVEENAVFIHEFSKKISLPWKGDTSLPHPPPSLARARSLRSLAYYRPPKIKSWLRHWEPPYHLGQAANPIRPQTFTIVITIIKSFKWNVIIIYHLDNERIPSLYIAVI